MISASDSMLEELRSDREFGGKTRPKGTATFYDVGSFGEVSHQQNQLDMKTCHMENVLKVLKFQFG